MFSRGITTKLQEALSDTPVVLLHGARQVGKSTLSKALINKQFPAKYLSLDDSILLAAAQSNPAGFLSSYDSPLIIDEVQLAPELYLPIKLSIDNNRSPGRFLLTGSADTLLLPELSTALVGRMEILQLWPLSQTEILQLNNNFIDTVFSNKLPFYKAPEKFRQQLIQMSWIGGFPEVVLRQTDSRRSSWFGSYINTLLQRDIKSLANVEGITSFPNLLSLLSTRVGCLQNTSELSRSSTIPNSTLVRYLTLLEASFLVRTIPAWSANLSKRLVKSPKVYLIDTGIVCYLLGVSQEKLAEDNKLFGQILENFVAMELLKQISWSTTRCNIYHFRTVHGQEVDFLLENPKGHVIGIEVKSTSTLQAKDFQGLKTLAELCGKRFHRGIVLYCGNDTVPFGERMHAMPVSALWQQ